MVLFRLIRVFRLLRGRKALSVGTIGLVLAFAVVGNAVTYYIFDASQDPQLSFGDALWYSVISITTIGYGDFSAASNWARLGTFIFIICIGLSTFTIFFGLIIDWLTEFAMKGERGMAQAYASNHVLIVHFPGAPRVRQLIDEIRSDPSRESREIVVISDRIEKLPFAEENVLFVRGSSLSEATYRQANVSEADMAIVLATDYSDPDSDAVVAAASSVIDTMKPEIHIVAECLNEDHRKLFDSVNCDAVVSGLRITGNLLVQEAQDPGISQMVDIITSNLEGDTLFSTEVGNGLDSSYGQVAKDLLDRNVNVLSVVRGDRTYTTFGDIKPKPGDRVIYLSDQRYAWNELSHMATA